MCTHTHALYCLTKSLSSISTKSTFWQVKATPLCYLDGVGGKVEKLLDHGEELVGEGYLRGAVHLRLDDVDAADVRRERWVCSVRSVCVQNQLRYVRCRCQCA